MSRIAQRTRRDLREIAGHAPISSNARNSILARADAPAARLHDKEVAMLEKNNYTIQHRPWVIPLGVAATIALGVAGLVLVTNRGDDATDLTPTDTVPPITAVDTETSTPPPVDEPVVVEVPTSLMSRAEEFDALMAGQDLPGVVIDDAADVTDVYELGDGEEPGQGAVAFEWQLDTGPVVGRLLLSESPDDPDLSGMRLFVDFGRGTAAGDAWIEAAAQTIVRMREPDLPESQIVDLAADLTEGDFYYEEVWSSIFVSTGDATTILVDGSSSHEYVESDRADPTADVTADQ